MTLKTPQDQQAVNARLTPQWDFAPEGALASRPQVGLEPREWSGPTQPPHTRSKQVKRIPRRLLPSHGEARAKEPRHRISGEQAVLELQARALLGLLVAFTSGGEGELRLGDHDLVHFMTTAGESQSNRGHLLLSQRSAAKPLQQARLEASRSF